MGERVSSEHPTVRTFRARVETTGATSRPRLALPPDATDHVPTGILRLVLDGTTLHAAIRSGSDGPIVSGAYDTASLARSPGTSENRLVEWLDAVGVGIGRSVLFDVVVPSFLYGARLPGTTTIYEAVEPPPSSLSRIADSLDG